MRLVFPFRYPMNDDTLIFGGIRTSMWMWSGIAWASMISTPLYSQSRRMYFPMSVRNFAYIAFLRYFGVNTMWYLQSHLVCAKLLVSSFLMAMKKSSFQGKGN